MNFDEQDYRIWKNENFVIESTITISLWDEILINDFHEKINKVLDEIYSRIGLISNNTKSLISISFSNDKNVIDLNNRFRKKKSATNVLTFPSNYKINNTLFIGDIIFSIETISREAKRDNKSINNHLIHLFIHGVLHLLGYDHRTEEEAKKMENLEIQILEKLKIDNPYKWINYIRNIKIKAMKINLPSFFKKTKDITDKNLDQELEQFVAKRINADDSNGKALSHENELLKNLAGLRGITASDVMVPRVDIVSVAMSDDFDKIVKQLIKTNHSRVPVRNESLDDIVGILHIKDVLANLFLKEKQDFKTLLKKPIFVSPSISLLDLLYEMRVKRRHLALVVDEYGGTDGLVTIEDLVEELVGDIEDEHDLSSECRLEKMKDGSIIVEARITVDLLEGLLSSIRKEDLNDEIETLGGFIISITGRVPVKGEVIRYSPSGLKFEILEADPRKVILVKIIGLKNSSTLKRLTL